jgi:DNA-binding MarR family transcriptional regulator
MRSPGTERSDFLDDLAELALGSRLKRLSDRMMSDAAAVYRRLGHDVQPKWFTLLALLHSKREVSVVAAAEYLGLSQPAISQFSRQLVEKGYITSRPAPEDSRRRLLELTERGAQVIETMQPLWRAVEEAARDICLELDNDFYEAIRKCERALDRKTLLERSLELYREPEP